MSKFTLDKLREQNVARLHRWHSNEIDEWTGADWSNATCGEAGEMANVVKKLRRGETGARNDDDPTEPELRAMLADEIADVAIYLDLLAWYYDIDLAEAIISKFDRTSERYGFPERLSTASASSTPRSGSDQPSRP